KLLATRSVTYLPPAISRGVVPRARGRPSALSERAAQPAIGRDSRTVAWWQSGKPHRSASAIGEAERPSDRETRSAGRGGEWLAGWGRPTAARRATGLDGRKHDVQVASAPRFPRVRCRRSDCTARPDRWAGARGCAHGGVRTTHYCTAHAHQLRHQLR